MKTNRRQILRSGTGLALGLPFLESLDPRRQAFAAPAEVPPFIIFFRQANGVQQGGQNDEIGREPERFWPTSTGALTAENMAGRTVGELAAYRQHLLLTKVNMANFDFGDGHARGAMQGLTASPAAVAGRGGGSEAGAESIDHRIGRELNPEGRESLYLYAGRTGGWLGGPCISYRGSAQRRSAINNPWNAYQSFVSEGGSLPPAVQQAVVAKGQSVNDLLQSQFSALLSHSRLSGDDRRRLQLHQQNIRDLEVSLTCQLSDDQERVLQGESTSFDSTNGDEVLATARLHMDVATLAVACGQTRSVAIQVGNGNDASTRYRNPDDGRLMENFHYVSHRRTSHGGGGSVIAGSDILHHYVDLQFARSFLHLVERLDAYPTADGGSLLEAGMAVWYNDLGDGPPHSPLSCPFIIAGSAGGQLRQGQFFDFDEGWGTVQHRQLLNTLGAAVGLTNADGAPLDDFGHHGSPGGRLEQLLA